MNIKALVVTVVAVALGATLLAQDRAREQKLQQAIDLLETKGDAVRAMPLLEDVAKSADQSLAARGLLYLGQAQEGQGKGAARRTYERIIRDFSNQSAVMIQARARLAALGNGRGALALRSDLTIRRLQTLQEPIDAISPDGARSLETDWNTGNILVREIATGQARPITTQPQGSGAKFEEWGEGAIFSPDGTQAAYNWCTTVEKGTATAASKCDGHLRISRIADAAQDKPRTLYSGASWAQPFDWSADSRQIAAIVTKPDRSVHIAVIAVADGTVRLLRALDDWPVRMAFSPDGRYLAYDLAPRRPQSGRSDVFVVPTAGGDATAVASGASGELLAGWTPDGSQVLFTSDRSGTIDLNGVRVVDGQPQGGPVLLKADLGPLSLARVSASGVLYYTTQSGGSSQIELASLDFSTGAGMTAPVPVGDLSPGTNSAPGWSPDGSSLAYLSRRSVNSRTTIVIRSTDSGASREVRPDLTAFQRVRWGLDPNVVYTVGTDGRGKMGLFTIDLQSAGTTLLSEGNLSNFSMTGDRRGVQFVRTVEETCHVVERNLSSGVERELFSFNGRGIPPDAFVSRDGAKLYYRLPREGATATAPASALMERDLASGSERVLLEGRLGFLSLSPNERYLAVPRNDPGAGRAMVLISLKGEPAVQVLMRADSSRLLVGGWARDSRSVLLFKPLLAPATPESWWVSVPDGVSRRLPHYVGAPVVHPDGKRLAFAAVSGEPRRFEIWALEHFLPTASTKKRP